MAKEIIRYKGLFGDNFESFDDSLIHHEPLRDRTVFYNFEIVEHVHPDLFQLFIITSGGGLLLSSGLKISLDSPCVLIIPSNRLHGFVFQSEIKGDVFTIPESLFEKMMRNDATLFSEFSQLQYIPLDSEDNFFIELKDLKHKIIHQLSSTEVFRKLSLSLLVQLLFINLYQSKTSGGIAPIQSDDRALNYFYQFKKLIRQYGHEARQVRFYAKEMKRSTVHLNRICQSVCQKSALQVIHEYVLQEAKKYLRGTSYSVAEIAYFLGFKDPAHFSKFFKKKQGQTPGSYRKKR